MSDMDKENGSMAATRLHAVLGPALYHHVHMRRAWDVLVGIFMILASLICQAIVILIVVGLLSAGIASYFNLKSEWWAWGSEIAAALALNVLTFYEFRRRLCAHRMLGVGGGFFLLPRGLYRIAYGRETYSEPPMIDEKK